MLKQIKKASYSDQKIGWNINHELVKFISDEINTNHSGYLCTINEEQIDSVITVLANNGYIVLEENDDSA